MARLPDKYDLGRRESLRQPRPIASLDMGQMGRAMERAGRQIQGVGQIAAQKQEEEDRFALAEAQSWFLREKIKADQEFADDPDWRTYDARYRARLEAAKQSAASRLNDDRTRRIFDLDAEGDILRGLSSLSTQARARRNDEGHARLLDTLEQNRELGLSAPDEVTRLEILRASRQAIDGAAEQGFISQTQAARERIRFGQEYALGYARRLPPEELLRALDGERVPSRPGTVPDVEPALMPEISATIEEAAETHGVDPAVMKRIAVIESSGDPAAANPRSSAKGLFQFIDGTAKAYGLSDPFDAGQSADAAARKIAEDRDLLSAALRREPTGGELYLAFQQGPAGAAALLTQPDENAVLVLTPVYKSEERARKAVVLNGGNEKMTAREFTNKWLDKFYEGGAAPETDVAEQMPGIPGTTGNLIDLIPADSRDRLRQEAQRALDQDRAVRRATLKTKIEDEVTALRQGNGSTEPVSRAELFAAYPPAEAEQMWETLQAERAFGQDLSELGMMSPDEIVRRTQALTPEGEGFAEESERFAIWQRAVQADLDARLKDPAAYVLKHSDKVRQIADAASEDPSQVRQLFSVLDEEQARLGIPEYDRRLLTKDQASSIVGRFVGVSPEEAANTIEGLSEQFGAAWPRVYGELVEAKLPENARVLAALNRPGQASARVALVEAMRTGRSDLKRAIGDQTAKDIGEDVRAELGEFIESTGFAPGGAALAAGVVDTVELLAMQYARSMEPTDAVRKAARDVVNDYYTFQDGYRVPIEYDPDNVRERSMLALDALSPEILHPRGTMFPNVPEENLRQSAYDAALAGRWVTNHDETGLIRLNSLNQPVVLDDGSFLTVPFKAPEGFAPRPKVPSGDRPLLGQPPFVPGGSFLNLPPGVLNR